MVSNFENYALIETTIDLHGALSESPFQQEREREKGRSTNVVHCTSTYYLATLIIRIFGVLILN